MNSITVMQGGKVRLQTTDLDKLRAEIAKAAGFQARVGVLGKTAARQDVGTLSNPQGLNNAEIGLKNEFGSKADNVPARSFLRVPIMMQLPKELRRIKKEQWIQAIVQNGIESALTQLGLLAEHVVVLGFASAGYGTWAPNSPYTIFLKRSAQPLIDKGELRQSITSDVEKVTP